MGLVALSLAPRLWSARLTRASSESASFFIDAIKPHAHAGTVALHDAKYQGKRVTRAIRDAGLVLKTPRVVFGMAH